MLPSIHGGSGDAYSSTMTAETRARLQYREHELARMKSRQRRSRQRNADRLDSLISHYNEVNRANRHVENGVDSSRTQAYSDGQETSIITSTQSISAGDITQSRGEVDFDIIAKTVMMLSDGGTRNQHLSVNEIVTFLRHTPWGEFVSWLLPPNDGPGLESLPIAQRGVNLSRFRAYDRDKNLKIELPELARALEDYCNSENRHSEISQLYDQTLARLKETADVKDSRRKDARRFAARKKRFDELSKRREDAAVSLAVPESLKVLRRQLLAASYVDGGADIQLALQRADKDHNNVIDCFELKKLIRSKMRIPKSKITDAQIFGVFRALDADESGAIEFKEWRKFMDGTLWQIKPPTPPLVVVARDWGSCGYGTGLPTPTHLMPNWKAPQTDDEYRPVTSLTKLIHIKPKKKLRRKQADQHVREVPTKKMHGNLSQKHFEAVTLRAKKKLEAAEQLVARIATPNLAAAANRGQQRLGNGREEGLLITQRFNGGEWG
jgi:Ca2+-binding EF-hand superfamily protein